MMFSVSFNIGCSGYFWDADGIATSLFGPSGYITEQSRNQFLPEWNSASGTVAIICYQVQSIIETAEFSINRPIWQVRIIHIRNMCD
jgi:hypothetical protein